MGMKRVLTQDAGSPPSVAGPASGLMSNILPVEVTADTNQTITNAQISAGAVYYTGFSAGRNLTVPTAAVLLQTFGDMSIGDTITMFVSIQDAFAGTWVTATGVTLRGRATTPASSFSVVCITRTGAATFDWTVL
jgi:hypothetical protein